MASHQLLINGTHSYNGPAHSPHSFIQRPWRQTTTQRAEEKPQNAAPDKPQFKCSLRWKCILLALGYASSLWASGRNECKTMGDGKVDERKMLSSICYGGGWGGRFPSLFKCVWLFSSHEVLAVCKTGRNRTHTWNMKDCHLWFLYRILCGHQSVCCTVQSTASDWSAAVPPLFSMQTQKHKREHEGRRAYSSKLCIKKRVN